MLVTHNGYMVSVINEAVSSFGEIPGLHREVITILKEARQHIQSIDDRIAVAATVAAMLCREGPQQCRPSR